MYVIVGLGNPEPKYLMTFHNMGFMAVDSFALKHSVNFTKDRKLKAEVGQTIINGNKVILVKPLTYMNLSGESVRAVVDYYKLPLENLMVVYDDLDLGIGCLRIRKGGQSGTHNGMRNITALLSSTAFPRMRIGTQKPPKLSAVPIIDYVLMNIPVDLQPVYKEVFKKTTLALEDFASGQDVEKIMCKYNGEAVATE